MSVRLQLIGKRFGRLLVTDLAPARGKQVAWICICDCGRSSVVYGSNLTTGHTLSCGCFLRDRIKEVFITHGKTRSRVYRIWGGMLSRCSNPNVRGFDRYGGRGISVCDRWRDFANFYADMGDPPPRHSLDRIDNEGNYEPGNCKWSTNREQSVNTRVNHRITFNGQTLCLTEWARLVGIKKACLEKRLKLGWPASKALTQPTRPQRNNAVSA